MKLVEEAQPKFFRGRQVPYAIREPIQQELTRLETQGIVERVSDNEWATALVPIPKGGPYDCVEAFNSMSSKL